MEEIIRLIAVHEVATVIAGVPANEDDSPTQQAMKTIHLIKHLETALAERELNIPIIRVNEYLSTQDARQLFPEADKDAGAAAVLLQDYLEANPSPHA